MKNYKNKCFICGKEFTTIYRKQNTCSFICRQEKNRRFTRCYMRKKRHPSKKIKHSFSTTSITSSKKVNEACIICGFNLTTDLHHEDTLEVILCPNHHALITRNIRTFKDLIKERDVNNLLKT